jgi:hypothetical protein
MFNSRKKGDTRVRPLSREPLVEAGDNRRCIIYDVGFILTVLGASRHAIIFD